MIRIAPGELQEWSGFIREICGVNLDQSKGYLLETRLHDLFDETSARSFRELLMRVKADRGDTLKQQVIDRITTNETSFFRDSSPFDLLRQKIFPELIDRRRQGMSAVRLKIWSAACSTGQELYSIAIILHEMMRLHPWLQAQLVGTDISNRAVATASKGFFNKIEMERGLPERERNRYFQITPQGWKIADEIRAMVHFRRLNLLDNFSGLGNFDLILCRNVAIYFEETVKKDLFYRIARQMPADGVLLIGSTESITGLCPIFESNRHLRSVFYTLKS